MFGHLGSIALLFAVEVAAFVRLLVLDADGVPYRLIPWDFRSLGAPWLVYGWDAIRAGFLPLWCPYVAAGVPFFLNPQTQIYSPLSILIGTVFGYSVRIAQIHSFLMMVIGGIGAYALAHWLWRNRVAAIFAGLCFELSGLLFCHLEHLSILTAFALMPWFFVAVALAKKETSRFGPPLLAFVLYWLLTAGYLGVDLMILAWGGALTVAQIFAQPSSKARMALLSRAARAWLVGIGMAAVNWLPFLLERAEFTRGSAMSVDYVLDPTRSLAPKHLLGFFFSFMIRQPLPGKEVDISMRGLYFGALAVVLAVIFMVYARGWRVLLLAAAALFSFLMACGGSFFARVALHTFVPVLNLSRFPAADSRAFVVLALVMLAGGGLILLLQGHAAARSLAKRIVRYLIVFYLLSIPVLHWLYERNDDFVVSGAVFEVLCLFLALFALVRFQGKTLAWMLTTIVVLETGYGVMVTFTPAGTTVSGAEYARLQNGHEPNFTTAGTAEPRLGDPAMLVDESSAEGYIAKRFHANEYNPVRLTRFAHLLDVGFGPWIQTGPRVVGMAPGRYPKTFSDFQTATFPVTFSIADYSPNRVRYHVETAAKTTLVFNEVYFPGWNAIVDGAPARVRPVAQGLRSVAVNKGKHEIELFFRPWPYFMGATVSVLFFLAFVAWLVVVWRRKRPSAPVETPVPFWTEPA
jgi:Bacterial membrane protein YfhO